MEKKIDELVANNLKKKNDIIKFKEEFLNSNIDLLLNNNKEKKKINYKNMNIRTFFEVNFLRTSELKSPFSLNISMVQNIN